MYCRNQNFWMCTLQRVVSSHCRATEAMETRATMAGVLVIEALVTKVGEQLPIMGQNVTQKSASCVKEIIGHRGVGPIQRVS